MDVSSLTSRVILSLRPSTRIHPITGWPSLFPSSLPIPPTACLTVSLPEGEGMRLPRSTYPTANTLGPLCSAGGNTARVGRSAIHPNHPLTVLVQALQLLWLVHIHDSYKCLLTLTIVSYPNTSPGWSFQERFHLTVSTPLAQANFGALSGRLHTHQGCTLSACFHRIAATERWVQARA